MGIGNFMKSIVNKQIQTDKQKIEIPNEITRSLGKCNYNKYNNASITKITTATKEEIESAVTTSSLWLEVD